MPEASSRVSSMSSGTKRQSVKYFVSDTALDSSKEMFPASQAIRPELYTPRRGFLTGNLKFIIMSIRESLGSVSEDTERREEVERITYVARASWDALKTLWRREALRGPTSRWACRRPSHPGTSYGPIPGRGSVLCCHDASIRSPRGTEPLPVGGISTPAQIYNHLIKFHIMKIIIF